jgi:hypothetical protein
MINKERKYQNSLTWLRIEPLGVFPYPLAFTRGLPEGTVTSEELMEIFGANQR